MQGILTMIQDTLQRKPDVKITVNTFFGEGDQVYARFTVHSKD